MSPKEKFEFYSPQSLSPSQQRIEGQRYSSEAESRFYLMHSKGEAGQSQGRQRQAAHRGESLMDVFGLGGLVELV